LEGITLFPFQNSLKKRFIAANHKGGRTWVWNRAGGNLMLNNLYLSFTARLLIPDNKIHCSPLPSRDIRGIGHAV
jgi:hypothetical protein